MKRFPRGRYRVTTIRGHAQQQPVSVLGEPMKRAVRTTMVCLIVSTLGTGEVLAQQKPLAGLFVRLLDLSTINKTSTLPTGVVVVHEPHFIVGESLKETTREMNVALASQLASFPLSSSSGGFSYTVNERGEVVPSSSTFGPAFAERAITIGRKKVNAGFSFQATNYSSFEGINLDSGGLSFIREHNDCCPAGANNPTSVTNFAPDFEKDLLLSNLSAKLETRTSAFFASVGVTDRFDLGVAIPVVKVLVDGTVSARIIRTGSAATPLTHSFDGLGADTATFSERGSSTGLGDILLRGKYNFFRDAASAVAGAVEIRLPTGDKDNLLGTGATQTRLSLIASGEYGMFSPHVNVGYTVSKGKTSSAASAFELDAATYQLQAVPNFNPPNTVDLSVPNEFNFTGGLSAGVTPRVTLGFDVVGRRIMDVARFELRDTSYPNRAPGTPPTAAFQEPNEFSLKDANGSLTTVLGVVGGKFNLGGSFILNATVLFPLSKGGLKPKPTPVIGLDYVF